MARQRATKRPAKVSAETLAQEPPPPPAIGPNLRRVRRQRNFSLDDLATLSGVSKAMLSQIETGKVNPTIATVWRVTHALGLDMSALLHGEEETVKLFDVRRREDLPLLRAEAPGVQIEVLSPLTSRDCLELYRLTLQPSAALRSLGHFSGTEELLTPIDGVVEVRAGGRKSRLSAGDTIHYQADAEHAVMNIDKTPVQVFLVVRFHGETA